jgi:hypothetical protein
MVSTTTTAELASKCQNKYTSIYDALII